MTITRVKLENFTVFESLDLEPSPGINVLVGANGTGKTHLMKVCYSVSESTTANVHVQDKLLKVFFPYRRHIRRLVSHSRGESSASIDVHQGSKSLRLEIRPDPGTATFASPSDSLRDSINDTSGSLYIPTKDMLANAPGFRSLYAAREVHFEEIYQDILDRAYLPALRNPAEFISTRVQDRLEAELGGKVVTHGEEFFLSGEQGEIEFTLLAEGLRKLGLLWLLIRNGSLRPGAVLFWDEPETNLNPKLYGVVIDVLLELQRLGVQIFLATHDYVILRELDLQVQEGDKVAFHSLYHEDGQICCHSTDKYLEIHPNAIMEAFDSIYDREIKRSLPGPA